MHRLKDFYHRFFVESYEDESARAKWRRLIQWLRFSVSPAYR